jgi:NitT/TauT family transport system substrate-binding protein
MFQVDPVIFMSHPGVGLDRFEDLPKATAFIASDMRASVWQWLKQAYGFKDQNAKPYNFNSAPFLADKTSIQEGILTSEPYAIERQGGFTPNVFLLHDYGYDSYSTTIETRADDHDWTWAALMMRRSSTGNYLYGDNAGANGMIKRDNPEMTDGQIAYSAPRARGSSFRARAAKASA